MRVAYICADPGVPVFGQKGCSIHVQEVIRALWRQGAQVHLFATSFDSYQPDDLIDVILHPLPTIPNVERVIREKIALAINPDLQLELELAGPFDWVYERYSLWSYSGMEYAKNKGIPGILEVNAPLIEEHSQHRGLVHQREAEQVAQKVFNDATTLIAVSGAVKDYLRNYVKNEAKIHVVPNGVNSKRFLVNLTSDSVFTVGFVGSLKPWHGLPILIEAFEIFHQQHPNTQLLIVGDGPERDRIWADIKAKQLQSAVHLTGAVPPATIPRLLATMNVAVAPYPDSVDFYFSPLKVYEYMAAGLPVVVSRIGQLAEIIEDGVNGLLCTPGDVQSLVIALTQLWYSPLLRHRLGQSARQTVLKYHTWDGVVERILALASIGTIYNQITEARG